MSLRDKLRRPVGRTAEPAPPPTPNGGGAGGDGVTGGGAGTRAGTGTGSGAPDLAGSVQVRHVDAGSCNGCEIEIGQAFSPVYDAEQYGARLVASPRHADALLVTGPVTRNMADPLVKTYEAMPQPRRVIAIGDCARDCGLFARGYGVAGAVADFVPVDAQVAGCPPHPQDIVAALQRLTGRGAAPRADEARADEGRADEGRADEARADEARAGSEEPASGGAAPAGI